VLFVSAAVWLVIGSTFFLIASIKFHSPEFLGNVRWLTYGRVWPAAVNSLLYGFGVQAGLGVALWLVVRLGDTPLLQRGLVTLGAAFWNLGVTVGALGILAGDSTGYENLEAPGYAAWIVFPGYLLIALFSVLTLHHRRVRPLYVSQWFVLTALFWFPWIYSTAELLLLQHPVRGVMQAVVAWWYSGNLVVVWFGLAGLAAIFYFVPRLTQRALYSRHLALFTFWLLILAGSWPEITKSAPVPAWMPALGAMSAMLMLVPTLAVALNVLRTLGRNYSNLRAHPALLFFGVGAAAFVVAGLVRGLMALLDGDPLVHLTWFSRAMMQLQVYGFFAMTMFGAVYCILPQLTGLEFPWAKLVRVHFWLALAGLVLLVVPLGIGGVVEGLKLRNPEVAFADIMKGTLPFLRASTVGDLLLALGHLVFLTNLVGMVNRFYRVRALSAYAAATADLFKAAEARP